MKGAFKRRSHWALPFALVGGLAALRINSGDGTAELKFETWNLKNEKFTDYFEGTDRPVREGEPRYHDQVGRPASRQLRGQTVHRRRCGRTAGRGRYGP